MKKLIHSNNMRFKGCNRVNPKKVTLRREESKERQEKSQIDKRGK